MQSVTVSPVIARKRKLLLLLPLFTLPFLTLAFWSMGGGKATGDQHTNTILPGGLNPQLPDASFKGENGMTKLSYYEKADYDSAKKEEQLRNDPYHTIKSISTIENSMPVTDSNEEKVYAKIAALKEAMNKRSVKVNEPDFRKTFDPNGNSDEADRLENMMRTMQQPHAAHDPEIDQLSGMLDKIMDIQHPERMKGVPGTSQKEGHVYPVLTDSPDRNVSLLVHDVTTKPEILPADTGFYSLSDPFSEEPINAIEAVIHENRSLVNGAVVKLRLLTAVTVNRTVIPTGNFIYGKASLAGERLTISVSSIRYNHSLFPVSLQVYDMDGMEGVFIPGAITRDAVKESSERAIQGIALNSLDPSIGAQAAGAGIEAAKNLLTRKVKLIKVFVKAGYKVLLKEKATSP
ncbi:MAG: conjugative transposon protein TraM [Chitinophagaceae bacterium]